MASKPAPLEMMRDGNARISLTFVRLIPRAADGGFALSHPAGFCPALNFDQSWLWGACVTQAPNPFRGQ